MSTQSAVNRDAKYTPGASAQSPTPSTDIGHQSEPPPEETQDTGELSNTHQRPARFGVGF